MSAWDVIVVGGGHAGGEAALASARMGCRTVLVTAGTFLRGLVHVGLARQRAGRAGEFGRLRAHTVAR